MKKFFCVLLVMGLFTTQLTGCGYRFYEKTESGYTQSRAVNGVVFDVPNTLIKDATLISAISKESSYENTYIYKNNGIEYLLFNIDTIVIAVSSGTNFNLQAKKDKYERIKENGLMNIWFDKVGKKFSYKEDKNKGVYKFIAPVTAEASINSNTYSTLLGTVSVLESGKKEYSLFVGATTNDEESLTKDQEIVIDHVSKSFMLDNTANIKEQKLSNEKKNEDTSTDESSNKSPQEESTEPPKFKESDRFCPLKIMDIGIADFLQDNGSFISSPVQLLDLTKGENANKLIRDAYHKEQREYEAAPDGYTWVLAHYKYARKAKNQYLNCSLLGENGENLMYQGVTVAKRTFDLSSLTKKNGEWYESYFYFALPNGCNQYTLLLGENKKTGAYYQVQEK